MAIVETRLSVWEALAGRAPGQPVGPADPGLWAAVVERLNPARAKPILRAGIEEVHLTSVRGVPYVMLRSPETEPAYLRLTPDEVALAHLCDGTRTVARLVAEFVRISGRLAPDQVTRVVADLAGNRMLAELPVDVFRPLERVHRRPWPVRLGRGMLAAAKGQRMVLANVDTLVGFLYRAGGRLLFTRVAAALLGTTALVGAGIFIATWWFGDQSVFLTGGSYAVGALVLLGLNVVALACHELGHALAAKHAGRRVPAAGFLVYFGIPSVFVDTTDVWMSGRRGRLLTTAAGPGAGLVLAGVAQVVGLVFPELAPWTFKLAFAWYLNALFNLNPFLALDGYYLLMDWLEVPNLRARGLSWVIARLRRRPPRWGQLDREGRLVALYGVLAILWLAIAVNLAYRIYSDRVSGLFTGLWRSGWPARVLLLAVVAGLASPLVYGLVRWLGRLQRRVREAFAVRRKALDLPRRLDALRASALGRLPEAVLADLAAAASWVRPRTGSQVVFAGAAQPSVFVVVDGALEGRRPGDPGGTVRQRVGPGGIVGLANALTGAPASLAWLTAGTTLLAVPSARVASAVGPLPGPPPADRADVEQLLVASPAFAGLSEEDRLGLVSRGQPLALSPGAPVVLAGADEAILVSSGVVVTPDGTELRRGSLIGPAGEVLAGAVATAHTPVRGWVLPAVAGLPLVLGRSARSAPRSGPGPGKAPNAGVHPPMGYPPLAAPPGPPPANVDDSTDRRFERIMWWLVLLLLLFALLLTGSNFLPGPAWAEMPADKALLRIDRGTAGAIVDGRPVALARGDEIYLGEGDAVDVRLRSSARLTFRGGATSVLCAGTSVGFGPLSSSSGVRPVSPYGELELRNGLMLADTASPSPAFRPLALRVSSGGTVVQNDGPAWYGIGASGNVDVSTGTVTVDGAILAPTDDELSCGDGQAVKRPSGTPSPTPGENPSPTPDPTLTTTPPDPTVTPTATPSTKSPTPSRTRSPTPPVVTSLPPRDLVPPVIGFVRRSPSLLAQVPPVGRRCTGQQATLTTATVFAGVTDASDPAGNLKVWFDWRLDTDGSSGGGETSGAMTLENNMFVGTFQVQWALSHYTGGTITVTVHARDRAGNLAKVLQTTLSLDVCKL